MGIRNRNLEQNSAKEHTQKESDKEPSIQADSTQFSGESLLAGDLEGRSVRGGATTLAGQAVKFVLQLGTTMALARLLRPEDFGLIAMAASVVGFLALFKDGGLSTATIQKSKITVSEVSTLFWVNVGLSAVLFLIIVGISPLVAWIYREPDLIKICVVIAVSFLFSGLSVQHQALLRRRMAFSKLAVIDVAATTMAALAALLIAWTTKSYWALAIMPVANAAGVAAGAWLALGWAPGRPRKSREVGAMLKFGGGIVGFQALNYLKRNADNLLVGIFAGKTALGLYHRAYHLLLLPVQQINAPLTNVAVSALSRVRHNKVIYRNTYSHFLSSVAMISLPIPFYFFLAAEGLVFLILGEQWGGAVPIFRLLALAALVDSLNIATGWVYKSWGHTRRQLKWGAFQTAVFVVAFSVSVHWGIEALAATCSIVALLLRIPALLYCYRGTPIEIDLFFRAIAVALAASTLSFAGILLLSHAMSGSFLERIGLLEITVIFWPGYIAILLAIPKARTKISSAAKLIFKKT